MTAWSAARLALKIALFTPSAGSLSESASSALGGTLKEVAHPEQSSRSPTTAAAADCTLLSRSALQTTRNTVIVSVGPSVGERILPSAICCVKTQAGSSPSPHYCLPHAAS